MNELIWLQFELINHTIKIQRTHYFEIIYMYIQWSQNRLHRDTVHELHETEMLHRGQ